MLTYKVKAKIRLEDLQVLGKRVRDKELKKSIEQQFETLICSSIKLAVKESKESGVDFLGIKDTFYRFCSKGHKNFDLKTVTVNVEASVILQT